MAPEMWANVQRAAAAHGLSAAAWIRQAIADRLRRERAEDERRRR
jgi:hypothetical protein